jgi:hypothetical protein
MLFALYYAEVVASCDFCLRTMRLGSTFPAVCAPLDEGSGNSLEGGLRNVSEPPGAVPVSNPAFPATVRKGAPIAAHLLLKEAGC